MILSQVLVPKSIVSELCSGRGSDDAPALSCSRSRVENVNFSDKGFRNIFINGNSKLVVRVAYQGTPGAYSEAAAMKAFPNCKTIPCEQFEDVMKAVEQWRVDKAVVPIENTVGGSVHCNYDLLLRHEGLHIVGEIHLVVDHCLLGLPGVRKEELKCVLSHPQALVQCEMSLRKLGVCQVTSDNTAIAAKIVAKERVRENGAIASARSAAIYDLDVLAHRFQDASNNITRFLLLGRVLTTPANDRRYKTSIAFTLKEGPGVLVEALAVFALRNINLCKIESRPHKQHRLRIVDSYKHTTDKYFDYFFFVDFEASLADPLAQYAIEHLKEFTKFIRILGCYPVDTNILQ